VISLASQRPPEKTGNYTEGFLVLTAEGKGEPGEKFHFFELRAAVCRTLERAKTEIWTETEPVWKGNLEDGLYCEMRVTPLAC
jgi:hypothetical protein